MFSIITVIVFVLIFSLSFIFGNKSVDRTMFNIEQTEFLKGIAIVLIILCHLIGQTHETVIATPLGGIGVAMFLFMSGFGLQESYKKSVLSGFWKKKVLRIFIPYAFFITIKSVISGDFNLKNYLFDIFFIHTSYWYIGCLVKWSIAFYISSLFHEKYKGYILLLSSVLSLLLLPNIEAEQSFSFVLGVMASIKIEDIRLQSNKFLYWIGVILLMIGFLSLMIKQLPVIRQNEITFLACQLLIKLPSALGLMILAGKLLPYSNVFVQCGIYSLELYLIHMKTLNIMQYNSICAYIISLVAFFVFTYVFSRVFSFLCKKVNKILS